MMPGRDGTGPVGNGPMTGWGRGICTAPRSVGYGRGVRRVTGRGIGRGRGFRSGTGYGCGRGFGRFWQAEGWEREDLKLEQEILKRRLEMIDAQLGNEKNNE